MVYFMQANVLRLALVINSSGCDYSSYTLENKNCLTVFIIFIVKTIGICNEMSDVLDDFKKWLVGKRYESGNEEGLLTTSAS